MLIRLKILVNFMQDFKKGIETANYLFMLSKKPSETGEEDFFIDADYARSLDEPVNQYLNIFEPTKRALHLYLAGLTYLIYVENSTSPHDSRWLYQKMKSLRKRAQSYL